MHEVTCFNAGALPRRRLEPESNLFLFLEMSLDPKLVDSARNRVCVCVCAHV